MSIIFNSMYLIVVILATIVWGIGVYLRSKSYLHIIQLEGYKNTNYLDWIKNNKNKVYTKSLILLALITIALAFVWVATDNTNLPIVGTVLWSILIVATIEFKKKPAKKELVFTPRAKRLLASNLVVILFAMTLGALLFLENLQMILVIATIVYILTPFAMYLGNILAIPIEKRINKHFYDMAYDKIRTFKDLNIVGITGSYGKTSVKFAASTILEEKFNVLKTPDSYNTPMGISKVINGTLSNEHEVFVAEMGARNIGDIKEMAHLAGPKIGILTSIGPTHLETFINIDNIMKTKYELIEELPPDGIAIFNYDNQHVKKLADKTFKEKILYGMDDIEALDIYATDIEVSELGLTFTLKDKDGNSISCATKLLGKHNISNLLAGAALGKALGLTFDEIARGILKVEPVPHRLQLMNPGTGVIVIDDSFNSNPISSKAALDVVSQFREGRKVIVTPGMVELGDQEEEANRQFGRYIAQACDYAILVGKNRTKPIYEGILEENFNKDNIFVVGSLDEGTQILQKILRPKDVVLFENDLPDTYDE